MKGATMPVGLQDWVNRTYFLIETKAPTMKPKADSFVTDTVRRMIDSRQLWKMHWIAYPVPSISQLDKAYGEPMVIDLEQQQKPTAAEYIPLEPAAKKSKKAAIKKPSRTSEHLSNEELRKRNERAEKFKEHLEDAISSSPEPTQISATNVQYEFGNDEEDVFEKTGQYSVIGTCTKKEKRYLRLTCAPDPSFVRPEPVLREWLSDLTSVWESRSRDWKYIEDQMRSIRQDLTVQNLRGEFTIHVYETNARWALESGDLGQFNQCQTQLKQLHSSLLATGADHLESRCEFISYRLLYYYLQSLRVDEQIFLNQILSEPAVANHRFVQFALAIRKAATTNNFVEYFRLSRVAMQGGAASHTKYLLAAFESRQRLFALTILTKSFVTQIAIEWLTQVLGFDSINDCEEFIACHGGVLKDSACIDPKLSHQKFSNSPLLVGSKLSLMG
jgi:hypothetical protein